MTTFCPHCGAPRPAEQPFCAACGQRIDSSSARRRSGNHAGTGLLLALLGGGWLFVPLFPSSLGNISIWQTHESCGGLVGFLAAQGCSTVTLMWAGGLGVLGLGVLVLVAALLRSDDAPRDNGPRSAPVAPPAPATVQAAPPATVLAAERSTPAFVAPREVEPEAVPVQVEPAAKASVKGSRPRLDQRRVGLGMALFGSIALVVLAIMFVSGQGAGPSASAVPSTPAAAEIATSTAPTVTLSPTVAPTPTFLVADVPVIACATTHGTGDVPTPTEASERLTLPTAAADRLAVFATNYNRVLAPREWRCTADVGANRTASLTVGPALSGESAKIVTEDAAASYGYILDLTCPLFIEAARLNQQTYGTACDTPPADEAVRYEGNTLAWFEDPPGVKGSGTDSGGSLSAIGVIYFSGGHEPTGAKVTCLLPTEDRDLCTIVAEDWLRRIGARQ